MATVEGQATQVPPKIPGPFARAAQAVAYVIAGVRPDTWFGPLQPLAPMAPAEVKGRAYDYVFGYNLQYTPRATEDVKFSELKRAARKADLLRLLIETRKDRMAVLDFEIRPKEEAIGKRPDPKKFQKEIDEIKAMLRSPDRRLDWGQWLKEVLDQNLVYDAVSIYRRKSRNGKPFSWEVIDGATIKPLIDTDGRTPMPPSPAYQQVIKGIPAANYATWTTGDMLYYPENPQVDSQYGLSRVEQCLRYVYLQINRLDSQIGFYEEGNVPEGFVEAPKEMTLDQVRSMQDLWDSIFAGLAAIKKRRKIWWVPQGSKYTALKEAALKSDIDEWIARVICFALSEDPTPFIRQQNRATAETAQLKAEAEGLLPSMIYVKRLVNKLIELDFPDHADKVEFAWSLDTEFDPVKKMTVDTGYVKNGILAIDEVRESLGEETLGGEYSKPMALTPQGYVQIKGIDPTAPKPVAAPVGPDGKPLKALPAPPGAAGAPGKGKDAADAKGAKAKAGQEGQDDAEKADGPVVRPVLNALDLAKWLDGLPVRGEKVAAVDLRVEIGKGTPSYLEPSALVVDGGPREVGNLLDGRLALFFDSVEILTRSAAMAEPEWHPRPAIPLTTGQASLVEPPRGEGDPVRKAREALDEAAERLGRSAEGDGREAALRAHGEAEEALAKAVAADPKPSPAAPYAGQMLIGAEEWGDGAAFPGGGGEVAGYPYKPSSTFSGESGHLPDPFAKATREQIDAAAAGADREPTQAEIAAGNYRMGHFRHGGLDFTVENAAGSRRSGTGPDGEAWSVVMPTHYGYVRRSEGADGDQVDCYFGPDPESERVWVLDQIDAETGRFDEHKCFVFFDSWAEAQTMYVAAFSDGRGHERMGHVSSMSFDEFRAWLAEGPRREPESMPLSKAAGQPRDDGGRYAAAAAAAQKATDRAKAASTKAGTRGTISNHRTAANRHGEAKGAHETARGLADKELAGKARTDAMAMHDAAISTHEQSVHYHTQNALGKAVGDREIEKIVHPHKERHGDEIWVVDDDKHVYGKHPSEDRANAQLAALYAAKDRESKKTVTVGTGLVTYDLRGAKRPDQRVVDEHEHRAASLFKRPKFEKVVRVWRGY